MATAVAIECGSPSRRELLALLWIGAGIHARKVVPFPHRFVLEWVQGESGKGRRYTASIAEHVVQGFVDAKVVTAKPQDELWDHIIFAQANLGPVRAELVREFPHGFGRCSVCSEFPLGAGRKGNAPRHGADEDHGIPPCEGSFKPLLNVVLAPETVGKLISNVA